MTNTHRSTPPSRRVVAGISAVLLGASVLAAAVSNPAQAANTASEVLLDHDDNTATAAVRQFGGTDRYDTALLLAEQFADSRGGLGTVSNAFLASGKSLVDAVAVAGLAGYLEAPVLLTPPDALQGRVGGFFQTYGIDNVWILGGTAAVSEAVENAVKALDHEPNVQRIAGTDRYETAAEIGRQIEGFAEWCDTNANSAILVNGKSDALFDAVSVSPIANRLQLPVLLTDADELPQHSIDFIRDEDIEHVAIIGNESGVSIAVARALRTAGVGTVTRYAGTDAAGTSAVLAELAVSGDCSDELAPVAATTVALVNRNGIPDGIAASPVLNGNVEGVAGVVPILLVSGSLPSAVQRYLAATPEEDSNGNKVNFNILAIGGDRAVTPGVMSAALNAAASAPPLSVDIVSSTDHDGDGQFDDRPEAGDTAIRLNFSDDISGNSTVTHDDTVELRKKLLDVLRINKRPAVLKAQTGSTAGVVYGGSPTDCSADAVTVNLTEPLNSGDSISIANTSLRFGAGADQRPLAGDSATVRNKESGQPTFTFVSVTGQKDFTVIAKDSGSSGQRATGLADGEGLVDTEVMVKNGTNTIASVSNNTVSADGEIVVTEFTFTVRMTNDIVSADDIEIVAGAIKDKAGNSNSVDDSSQPSSPKELPSLTANNVDISSHFHAVQAKYAVPIALTAGNAAVGGSPDIFFTAKPSGNAAGALGNGWTFDYRLASTYDADKPVSIEPHVDTKIQRVFVTFMNGKPKFADLAAALSEHRSFNALWEVSIENKPNTCVTADSELTVLAAITDARVTDGITKMAIEAKFDGLVKLVHGDELLQDVFAFTKTRVPAANPDISADGINTAKLDAIADGEADISGPLTTVRYIVSTTDVSWLPKSGDDVVTEAATIAGGYASDDDDTDVDESMNKASKVDITTGAAKPTS